MVDPIALGSEHNVPVKRLTVLLVILVVRWSVNNVKVLVSHSSKSILKCWLPVKKADTYKGIESRTFFLRAHTHARACIVHYIVSL